MQQALEFCESVQGGCTDSDDGTVDAITVWCPELISALRAALAEPEPPIERLKAQRNALRAELREATEAMDDPAVNNLRTLPEAIRMLRAERDREVAKRGGNG